jgi:hypothetical protein
VREWRPLRLSCRRFVPILFPFFFGVAVLEQRHLLLTVIEIDVVVGRSILHLFPWSGIIDENQELSNTFRVPDLTTGRMSRLITQLSPKEEEMFRNMIRRMNTIVKVVEDCRWVFVGGNV